MRKTIGRLFGEEIIVSNPRDIGRLHSRSKFGVRKGNSLYLNILEGVFLLDEDRIRILERGDREIAFKELFQIASDKVENFEDLYRVYQDLRHRGYHPIIEDSSLTLHRGEGRENPLIVFNEGENIKVSSLKKLCVDRETILALVDEEGDLTYYELQIIKPVGEIGKENLPETNGFLLSNKVFIFDVNAARILHAREFYGSLRRNYLHLSLLEALYLMEKKKLSILDGDRLLDESDFLEYIKKRYPSSLQRYEVFKDLKNRGLIVKTGFKFGVHFRVYTNLPEFTHSEYLIHVINPSMKETWSEISRGVRLAHAVNKTFLFAFPEEEDIIYLKLKRIRP